MKHLPHLCLISVCLTTPCAVQAQPGLGDTATHEVGHWLAMSSPRQIVRFGNVEMLFEADVTICHDRTNRGFGFVTFETDGSALQLQPVWGGVDFRTGGVVLTFVPVLDREIGPEDIVVAIVHPAIKDPDCLIWDFTGTEVLSGILPPVFEAEGTISLSRGGGTCEPSRYGSLRTLLTINVDAQPVDPLPPSGIGGFGARLQLHRDESVRGFLDVYLPRRTVSYEPMFGAAFPGDDEFLVRTIVVLLLADRQAPLNTNDHVLRATVGVERINPDCQLWDLLNGATGQVNGMFDAQGSMQLTSINGNLQISSLD